MLFRSMERMSLSSPMSFLALSSDKSIRARSEMRRTSLIVSDMDFLQKWMPRKVLFLQVTRNSFPDSKIPFLVYHLRLPYVLLKAVKAVTKYVPKRGGKGNLMFGSIRNYFSNDLAIDLGTANTLIYCRDRKSVV